MTRPGAVAARDDLESTGSPHALIWFLKLDHPSLTEPMRAVSDVLPYIWDGARWEGIPFDAKVLTDNETAPEGRLRLQNVDRLIGQAVRALPDRATIQMTCLSTAEFDLTKDPREPLGMPVPVYQLRAAELIDVEVNAIEVSGRIFIRDYGQEPFGLLATQSRAPGLFR